jgi:hypothetical protein
MCARLCFGGLLNRDPGIWHCEGKGWSMIGDTLYWDGSDDGFMAALMM